MPFVVVVPLVCVVLHPLLLMLCIHTFQFDGVAIASVGSLWLMALLSGLYVFYMQPHDPRTWPGFKLDKLKDTKRVILFTKLGCSGLISMSEW